MLFLGRVVQCYEMNKSYKAAIAVETGYYTVIYSVEIPPHFFKSIPNIGAQVLFWGREKRNDNSSYFILDFIKYQNFTSCIECGIPLVSIKCKYNHDSKALKFEGKFKIVQKMFRADYLKLFFLQGSFSFSAVAQPKDYLTLKWLYSQFTVLEEGDYVYLKAWRYNGKTSISFIEKIVNDEK